MDLVKVKDRSGLYRDEYSNGIVNMNENEYKTYIENYKKCYNEKQKIKNLENDVNSIKNDLSEIKDLLRNLSK